MDRFAIISFLSCEHTYVFPLSLCQAPSMPLVARNACIASGAQASRNVRIGPSDWSRIFVIDTNVSHQLPRQILDRSKDAASNDVALDA